MVTAVKRPAGETRGKVAAGPHAGQRHRASPRPYPVQRRRPPVIMREAARRQARDSGTLSGTSLRHEALCRIPRAAGRDWREYLWI
jgi:hypothetical protein